MEPQKMQLIIILSLYIITGILQPTIIDYLRIHHYLGHKGLLIPTLANTLGMAFVGFMVSKEKWQTFLVTMPSKMKKMILMTAFVDLISGMCLTLGLLYTGGGIFVILYNSCPMWTALLSFFWAGKKLNLVQILGVSLVSVGLIMNVYGSSTQQSKSQSTEMNHMVIFGSCVVLIGSFLHSLMFVLSDYSMKKNYGNDGTDDISKNDNNSNTISGEIWSSCLGSIEATFMFFWVFIGILLTGFHDNYHNDYAGDDINQMVIQNNSVTHAFFGFISLVFISAIHAFAFFRLLKNLGAVASALLKGIQAIVVIGISAVFYCGPTNPEQCLTMTKFMSAFVVLTGVLLYGVGSNAKGSSGTGVQQSQKDTKIEEESKSLI